MELLHERFGVESTDVPTAGATFSVGDEPAEWEARIAVGARGGSIVELIEPVAADLVHYLEICQLQAADIEFFTGLVEQNA